MAGGCCRWIGVSQPTPQLPDFGSKLFDFGFQLFDPLLLELNLSHQSTNNRLSLRRLPSDNLFCQTVNHSRVVNDSRTQGQVSFTVQPVNGYICGGLPALFESVAANWQTFTGPESWSSLECEFNIEITHDGLGHFNLRVSLDSRSGDPDWELISNFVVETAQLDRIPADIRSFIGACS